MFSYHPVNLLMTALTTPFTTSTWYREVEHHQRSDAKQISLTLPNVPPPPPHTHIHIQITSTHLSASGPAECSAVADAPRAVALRRRAALRVPHPCLLRGLGSRMQCGERRQPGGHPSSAPPGPTQPVQFQHVGCAVKVGSRGGHGRSSEYKERT